ncbi:MAG: DJ-1/PfpI family protein [Lachnospiraceae bacterium]|jgi:4-methyl-5(b-hydroxyethyl)-thiazole monophosphate biosynthesis|nr:DJ-1/PfpI family protein [Lachnospiraceae bacterium]
MAKVYAMIANGTEEVECLAVVDILRRSGIETVLVSVEGTKAVISSHNVKIEADATVEETDFSDGDVIFLPGGMPGSEHLSGCEPLLAALTQADKEGRRIAAICAAPGVVLGRHGFLKGRTATCFPGFEKEFESGAYTRQGVVTDGNITTARGLGFAIDLGIELVRILISDEAAEDVKGKIQYC